MAPSFKWIYWLLIIWFLPAWEVRAHLNMCNYIGISNTGQTYDSGCQSTVVLQLFLDDLNGNHFQQKISTAKPWTRNFSMISFNLLRWAGLRTGGSWTISKIKWEMYSVLYISWSGNTKFTLAVLFIACILTWHYIKITVLTWWINAFFVGSLTYTCTNCPDLLHHVLHYRPQKIAVTNTFPTLDSMVFLYFESYINNHQQLVISQHPYINIKQSIWQLISMHKLTLNWNCGSS